MVGTVPVVNVPIKVSYLHVAVLLCTLGGRLEFLELFRNGSGGDARVMLNTLEHVISRTGSKNSWIVDNTHLFSTGVKFPELLYRSAKVAGRRMKYSIVSIYTLFHFMFDNFSL